MTRAEVARLAPVDTWPDLRVTVHLLPWTWHIRPRGYVDDVDGAKGHCSFRWLCLDVEWWGNKRLFTEMRAALSTDGDVRSDVREGR